MTKSTAENCQDDNTNLNVDNIIKPDNKGDNMNDLKPLDFNSADDVRQTLKAIFTNKLPKFDVNAEEHIGIKNVCDNDVVRYKNQHGISLAIETDDCKLNNDKKSTDLCLLNKGDGKRRRGRPPKTGPSKKMKRKSVSTMYIGKLSNLVFLKHANESDSDIDSVIS